MRSLFDSVVSNRIPRSVLMVTGFFLSLSLGCVGQGVQVRPAASSPPGAPGGQPPAAQPTTTPAPIPVDQIKVGFTSAGATMAPLWIAKELGIFQKYGMDVDISFIQPGAPIRAALQNGDVHYSVQGGTLVVLSDLGGADHVIVASLLGRLVNSIYADPSIRTAASLRGKKVAIASFGSISHYAGIIGLESLGLNPSQDVEFVQTPGLPEAVAMLESGQVAGAVLSPPHTFNVAKRGYRELVDVASLPAPFVLSAIVVTKSYLRQNERQVEKFIRSLIEGIHAFTTDRGKAIQIIGKYTRTEDSELLDATYDYFKDKFTRDLVPSPDGMRRIIELVAQERPDAQGKEVADFMDAGIAQRIKASGFIEAIYSQR